MKTPTPTLNNNDNYYMETPQQSPYPEEIKTNYFKNNECQRFLMHIKSCKECQKEIGLFTNKSFSMKGLQNNKMIVKILRSQLITIEILLY
jgi:hypothetical protein